MNTLIIKNEGLIVEEDLTLLGSSTKKGATNKIGMFGSGWKYALAWLVRNNVDVRIYSGHKEIPISFNTKKHRNKDVGVITINGKETSITTEFGVEDWTGWMAIREILSNAIDEGNHEIFTPFNYKEEEILSEDTTTVCIPMIKELASVMRQYDTYFSFERKADYMDEDGNLYYTRKDDQPIAIYRKGIRCLDWNTNSKFDINFRDIKINESRLTSTGEVKDKMEQLVAQGRVPFEVFIMLVKHDSSTFIPYHCNSNIEAYCRKAIEKGYEITTGFMLQAQLMNSSFLEADLTPTALQLVVPAKWYNYLLKKGLVKGLNNLIGSENLPVDARTASFNLDALIKERLEAFNMETLPMTACEWEESEIVYLLEGHLYYKVDPKWDDRERENNATKIAAKVPYRMNTSHFRVMIMNHLANKNQ